MKGGEKCLLLAVRNVLRRAVESGGAGYSPEECEVEHDEQAPAVVGQRYCVIMAGGWTPGPRHNTSGGVYDLLFSVDVAIIVRAAHVPRDKMREVYVGNLGALNEEVDNIITAIDFGGSLTNSYAVQTEANSLLSTLVGSSEGFCEPLKFAGVTRRPEVVSPEFFGGRGEGRAGMKRVVSFGGARRITTR